MFDFSSGDKKPSSGAKLFSNRLENQHTETIFQGHTKIALFYKVCDTIHNGLIVASSLCVSTVNKGESRYQLYNLTAIKVTNNSSVPTPLIWDFPSPGPVTCSAAHTRLGKNIGNAPAPWVFMIGQESVGVLVRLFMVAGFTCEEMVLRPANG